MMSSLRRYFYPIGSLIRNYGVPSKGSHLTHLPCRRYARDLNLYFSGGRGYAYTSHGKRSRNRYIYANALSDRDSANAARSGNARDFYLSCGLYSDRTNVTRTCYTGYGCICWPCNRYTANIACGGNSRYKPASS
jgi:hypothetical protein